jgi:homoserine O-acetyltransferase/O-succinyltransferase
VSALGRVRTHSLTLPGPLVLESGARLERVEVAYETYGTPAADGGNVVVVCHALTGDAHAAGHHGDPARPGWWDTLIGPGKPVDTDRFFVVSPNLLGGCKGTTGPASEDPATGRPYGLDFPLFTVRDLVSVHRALLRELGIERVHAAIGGSLGGMQALQWALDHPGELARAAVICASARLSAQNIAFSKTARAAILGDPAFDANAPLGMGVARMMAHITYLSEQGMELKFARARRNPDAGMSFASDFEVEYYLDHQARIFLERFDARTYLYLSRCMDYFEPFEETVLAPSARFLLVSFDSDWRFGTEHSAYIEAALRRLGADVVHHDVASPWGHDSFLMAVPEYHAHVAGFLRAPDRLRVAR